MRDNACVVSGRRATVAHAFHFQRQFFHPECVLRRFFPNHLFDRIGGNFLRAMTHATDQEQRAVTFARVRAADKRIEAIDAVHKPLFEQKIQCAVDRGRRGPVAVFGELFQQGVGADRLVAGPDQFQHPLANRREFDAIARAGCHRSGKRILPALAVLTVIADKRVVFVTV